MHVLGRRQSDGGLRRRRGAAERGDGGGGAHGFDDAGADAGHGALDPLVTRRRQDEGIAGEDRREQRVALIQDVLYRRELLLEDVVDEPCDVSLLQTGSDTD